MRDAAGVHSQNITVDQAVIAAADTDTFDSTVQAGPHHSADGRVHTRRIAAAGQHADSLYCIFHKNTSFFHEW